eukprot:3260788-Amphidinium_carterae.1
MATDDHHAQFALINLLANAGHCSKTASNEEPRQERAGSPYHLECEVDSGLSLNGYGGFSCCTSWA